MRTAVCDGISVLVESYATRTRETDGSPAELILLSLVGASTAVTAIWAGFIGGQSIHLKENGRFRRLTSIQSEDDEKLRYKTFRKVLPRLGKVHFIIAAEQAVTSLVHPGSTFFVVGRSQEEAAGRFKLAFDRALPHPALDEWATTLLSRGRDQGLLRETESVDCHVLEVSSDSEAWRSVISDIAKESGR